MENNYFELLQLKQSYKIDPNILRQQYLLMQQKFHPDQAEASFKKEYIEKSMLINEAYKILTDDYKRAEYLLKINNIELSDQALNSHLTPQELEEILTQHEIIDEMKQIVDLQSKMEEKLTEKTDLMQKINECFTAKDLAKALDLTVRLKYLVNIIAIIKTKIRNADN